MPGNVRPEQALTPYLTPTRAIFNSSATEDVAAFFEQYALALSFAFSLDPKRAAAECTGIETDGYVFQDGVYTTLRTTGRVVMTRDADVVARTIADQIMVLMLEEGSVTFRDGERVHALRPGEIIVIDLKETCQLSEHDDLLTNLTLSRASLSKAFRTGGLHGQVIAADHPMSPILFGFARGFRQTCSQMRVDQAERTFAQLVALLALALEGEGQSSPTPPSIVADVETLIEKHIGEPALSPAWICEKMQLSRAALYREFESYGGVTLYIRNRRMLRALELAATKPASSLEDASQRVGYAGGSQFNRAFTRKYGMSYPQAAARSPDDLELRRLIDEERHGFWRRRSGFV